MSDESLVRDVALGAFDGYGAAFFQQLRIDQSKSGFELELPGAILRCGDARVFGYKDAAVVVNDEGEGRRAAWLGSHVDDTAELVRAIYELGEEVDRTTAVGFAVRLKTETTVTELLDRLDGGGCGCDSGDGEGIALALPASIRVALAPDTTKFVWSEPVAARMVASPFPASSTVRSEEECTPIAVGPNATACYGSKSVTWNGWVPEVHTACVGRCSSGDCCIRRTKAGTCVATADGWHSCSCI